MDEAARNLARAPDWLLPMGMALLGAVLGSFIAALVIRWPQGRSVMTGRSHCDACDAVLTPRDLVPLFSAMANWGQCRHCGVAIDPLHWRIELAALVIGLSGASLVGWPEALAAAILGWLLLALAALDITDFWLPDRLTITLALAGLASGLLGIAPSVQDRLIGGLGGYVSLWAIAAAYKAYRGRDGMGGGDPKLLGAIGLWTGWSLLPVTLVLAGMAGLGVALFWMLTGRGARADDRLPFGALLAIAAYPTVLAMLMFSA